ncbi:hypothetical protein [Pseudomonas sp. NA-150]|uniref:hypothetical protein n=1 Tax=Pseudomonas sp. NA-150 TaxID=3367525 RepID=UPI0037C61976
MDTESETNKESSASTPTLSARLSAIYADQQLSPTEYQALRDDADVVMSALIKQFPNVGYLGIFQTLADLIAQSMQLGIIEIRKTKPSPEVKVQVKESYAYQVAYIKACLDIFTQRL